jgi:hypothetical protein
MSGRRVSRRDAASGGIAMLVLAATAAGSAQAAELDGELLSSAAEWRRLVAQDKATWRSLEDEETAAGQAYWDEAAASGGIWDRIHDAAERVMARPATTPEGIRAKASVLQQMLREHQIEEGCANEEIRVALSLVSDIMGRVG